MSAIISKVFFGTLVAFSAAYSSFHGEVGVSAGYQIETLKQQYEASGTEHKIEFDQIGAPVSELSALFSFNHNVYLRGAGALGESHFGFRKKHYEDGVLISETTGTKVYARSWLSAIGWQFDFADSAYTLCLEGGYQYSALKYVITENLRQRCRSIFLGMLAHLPLNSRWFVDLSIDYIFSGTRLERVEGEDFNMGKYQGPLTSALLGVDFSEHWSVGLNWKMRYLFSDHTSSTATLKNEHSRWLMNRFVLLLSCRF